MLQRVTHRLIKESASDSQFLLINIYVSINRVIVRRILIVYKLFKLRQAGTLHGINIAAGE